MKLPNGYGNVSKLPGKRRNPWRARKSTWVTENGTVSQKYINIGYYATRKEALEALTAYNENPYDISTNTITFAEVYNKWSSVHYEEIVPSAVRTWVAAYNHSSPLHNMRMRDIRASHLEGCIHDADIGSATKSRMKSLYNQMFKYALKHDIVDKDYASLVDPVKNGAPVIVRVPFTDDEIEILKDNAYSVPFADMVLIGIYSGWRPQELAILKVDDVDMSSLTMKGGLKTDAGKNRIVPIHPYIADMVNSRLLDARKQGSEYLFNDIYGQQGTYMTYDKYRGRFNKVMKALKISHRPHDTRHTFVTLAKKYKVDDYILKIIVGHSINDITEKIYTHREITEIYNEICKIK